MGKAIHAAGLLQTRVWDYAARKRHQHVAIQPSCMCWILSRIKSLLVPVCPCQSRSVVILLRHAGVIRPNLARCKVSKNLRLFRACFASLLCELFWFFILLWNVFFLTAAGSATRVGRCRTTKTVPTLLATCCLFASSKVPPRSKTFQKCIPNKTNAITIRRWLESYSFAHGNGW